MVTVNTADNFYFREFDQALFWQNRRSFLSEIESTHVIPSSLTQVTGQKLVKALQSILPLPLYKLSDHAYESQNWSTPYDIGPIVQLITKVCARLITYRTEVLKMKAEKADQLGIVRSSGTFVYALIIVSYLSQYTIYARLNNLRILGLSQLEVALMICKTPLLLKKPEEVVGKRMKFLIKEHVIPGLHRPYADDSAGNIVEIEWF